MAGAVKCWGYNLFGQLGNGTTIDSTAPVAVTGITFATAITAGFGHTCALIVDGTVTCWGYNGAGQLGNGTTTDSHTPAAAVTGITTATAIAAGDLHTCALLTGGTVKCWGYNDYGQLGNGNTSSSSTPVVTGITTATSDRGQRCKYLRPAHRRHRQCWGYNGSGQLGNGTTTDSHTAPAAVTGITTATAITASGDHTCALLAGGTVTCWGAN